jgi:CDP-Glycerol:Poly(glycerophosphate) glycerophosphotransferase
VTSIAPVVLLSIPHGGSAGNVLRTGLVNRLLASPSAPVLVIVSPLVEDAAFVREFEHPRVRFEPLPRHTPSGVEGRLFALVQAAYIDSGVTESVKIRRAEAAAKKTIRWIRLKRLLASAMAPSIVRKETRYALVDRLTAHPWADSLFDRYRPVLLVASNPGLILSEVPLLRTAVRRGVRSMAVDPSWDNFTNKLIPVRRVDRLIVWNDLMKQQAIDLHGYAASEVRVAGTPQWDLYFREGTIAPREAFFRQIGADPARKLVTVTTTPRELYPHHDHVLRVLIQAITESAWHERAQLLVRLHPRDELEAYAEFEGVPNVIIEKPFRATVKAGDGLAIDITSENQRHLANTMCHSDVVVNVASTLAIEAAIFDTPVVNVAFDGAEPSEWVRSARRYYRFTHYVNITRHGAVRVAEHPAQLVEHVGRYLDDPTLDRDGRARVAREQCQFLDGRAAERVAAFVAGELADVCGGSSLLPCAESLASSR